MAKRQHRVFEIFDFRDEAIRALTPRSADHVTGESVLESWDFTLLTASRFDSVTNVRFKNPDKLNDGDVSALRRDFAQLTERLGSASKILLDFSGLASISSDSIDTLATFNKSLRHKGSRMVLCCLDSTARNYFYPAR